MTQPPAVALPLRTLGSCGITVPALGVGCWAIGGPDHNLGLPMGWGPVDEDDAIVGLTTAYQLGARLFDTADVYGHGRSERLIGQLVAMDDVRRSDLVLSSKVGYFSGTAAHGYDPGHMRHQLEQTLANLGTDYLDLYFLHHADFGTGDRRLDGAVEAMHRFRDEGLVRAVGMRGPHRFALDRLDAARPRVDKVARFRHLFDRVQPDVLAVRDNLLTPQARSEGIFAFADERGCGILINKPLAQGLLTGAYDPTSPREFGDGDHRYRKRWFTPPALVVLTEGLAELRAHVGTDAVDLVRIALWSCLERSTNAAVLVGFSRPEQISMTLNSLGTRPSVVDVATAREIMGRVQARLDAGGEVFTDERAVIS